MTTLTVISSRHKKQYPIINFQREEDLRAYYKKTKIIFKKMTTAINPILRTTNTPVL